MVNWMVVVLVLLTALAVGAGQETYRDAQGRLQGTKSTDASGRTTYRDAQGRLQGTATTDASGRTTYRDAQGRLQGTKK